MYETMIKGRYAYLKASEIYFEVYSERSFLLHVIFTYDMKFETNGYSLF